MDYENTLTQYLLILRFNTAINTAILWYTATFDPVSHNYSVKRYGTLDIQALSL